MHSCQDRGRAAVGEVEQVLHADDLGAVRGVPELFEADVAQADTSDETLVAGLDHGGQLIIEARVGAAGAGQTEVDRGQLVDPQAAEIVFDALAQLACIVGGTAPASRKTPTLLTIASSRG